MTRTARIVDFEEARSASRRSHRTRDDSAGSESLHRDASRAVMPTARPLAHQREDSREHARVAPNRDARNRAVHGGEAAGARRGSRPPRVSDRRTVAGTLKQRQHDARKRKADRAFDRTVKSDAPAAESGPRPAVYRGQMGATHRKSSRMRTQQEAVARSVAIPHAGTGSVSNVPRFAKIIGAIAACMLICVAAVYQPAHDYYVAVRDEAKAQAQLEVLNQQNELLKQEVAYLSSDTGIQDQAALNYGWVQEGENPVVVTGVTSEANPLEPANIACVAAVKAPDTWYSGFLDPLFGYSG
ncbi:FtsB family cell division protein [Curtanaerobium respiraculi]|uniref:FtsB family cell division protein n=1 Tax=Curtanaerobium respiraculi TaxID=2949669 RepID=UPI0024B37A65|nr:septum formation initiator family protein [Curtanaerobium respiraculi]